AEDTMGSMTRKALGSPRAASGARRRPRAFRRPQRGSAATLRGLHGVRQGHAAAGLTWALLVRGELAGLPWRERRHPGTVLSSNPGTWSRGAPRWPGHDVQPHPRLTGLGCLARVGAAAGVPRQNGTGRPTGLQTALGLPGGPPDAQNE